MRKLTFCVVVLSVIAMVGTAGAEAAKEELPLRLELELVDGSHIVGVPGIASLPCQTSYAKMDVPLKQLMTVKIGDDHETVSIGLMNGDKLEAVLHLAPLQLETVFGKVSVGIEHIKEIHILQTGATLPAALREGLVLYYSFDRDEVGVVTDASGKKHDGAAKGAKWTGAGKRGGGFAFDGQEGYIDAGTSSDWDFDSSKSWTYAFWVKPRVSLATMCFYCRAGDNDSLSGDENYLYYQSAHGSEPEGLSWGPINGEWDTAATLVLDQWQQIVMTYDASTRKASVYVNGVEKNSIKARSVGSSTGPLKIGDNANCEYLNGLLDEVMIFNRALTDDEIKQIYDAQK